MTRVDRAALEASLAALVTSTKLPPEQGFFGPDSVAWRVLRERALVTHAPRAVMLQYAYPPFAAASASYGAHAADPGARFERAVSTLLAMIFGERDRALRDARRLFLLHDRLHGTTEQGRPFHGNDRASLAWILVTLVDAAIRGYERHLGPLQDERGLFAEAVRFAGLFGLGPGDVPSSRAELDGAIDRAVETELVVGKEARAMWRFLGDGSESGEGSGPAPRGTRSLIRSAIADVGAAARGSVVTSWAAATLPLALRQTLAPSMRAVRAKRIEHAGSLLRARSLPTSVRYADAYRSALERLRLRA